MCDYNFYTPLFDTLTKSDLNLYYYGAQQCKNGHSWGPGVKEYYKIHFIQSGKGTFITGGKTYKLEKGQLFLIVPGAVSFYKADEQDPWAYCWVAFNGLNAPHYLKRAGFSANQPVIRSCSNEEIVQCFSTMFAESPNQKSGDLALLSSLYRFFSILIQNNPSMGFPSGTENNGNVYTERAIQFIKMNYCKNIKIHMIADFLGLNRKYFSKLFKENTGVSPVCFLQSYRLNKACDLMRNTELGIGEIARSIGYSY